MICYLNLFETHTKLVRVGLCSRPLETNFPFKLSGTQASSSIRSSETVHVLKKQDVRAHVL